MPKFKVYYARRPVFQIDLDLTPENLLESHVFIGEIDAISIDHLYSMMQAEYRKLTDDDKKLIFSEKIHTSMSVGDVAIDENGFIWECAFAGWRNVGGKIQSYWKDLPFPPRISRQNRIILPDQPRPEWWVNR